MGQGEARAGGRKKTAILSDICESLIGAVFLDGLLEKSSLVTLLTAALLALLAQTTQRWFAIGIMLEAGATVTYGPLGRPLYSPLAEQPIRFAGAETFVYRLTVTTEGYRLPRPPQYRPQSMAHDVRCAARLGRRASLGLIRG